MDPSQFSPAYWTDSAEVRAKIISRTQHKKMCSWCPPSSPLQRILPCDPTGDPSPGAAASLSFLSKAPPLKNSVETCGIQMKPGRCVVAMGSSRRNHVIWKTQWGLFYSAKAEMKLQELPHSALLLSISTSPWGAEEGKFHCKLLNHPRESTLNCRDFPQDLFPEGEHKGSHKHGSRSASWRQCA